MKRRNIQLGFTLIELVLVLVVLCIALAAVAPQLRGWSRGSKMRDAAEEFLAVTRWARSQAVSEARTYRLQVNSLGTSYQLKMQDGGQFVELRQEFGRVFALPEGVRMELTPPADGAKDHIDFLATGRCQAARVRMIDNDGDAVEIECPTPAENFRILAPGEQPS